MKGSIVNISVRPSGWKTTVKGFGAAATLLLLVGHAQSQTIYRIVGADGKVTFSDKPPAAASAATTTDAGDKPQTSPGAALPYELRQVVGRYPVTLYTSSDCPPCNAGRTLLSRRGVPFSEKTVTSAEDARALKSISGENSLPFLTIGGQQIKGYSDSEWTQFLNAAGSPKSSQLPARYQNPAATPLVVVQAVEASAKPDEAPTPARALAAPPPPPVDPNANPAGIKF